jgi:hypothetical protein
LWKFEFHWVFEVWHWSFVSEHSNVSEEGAVCGNELPQEGNAHRRLTVTEQGEGQRHGTISSGQFMLRRLQAERSDGSPASVWREQVLSPTGTFDGEAALKPGSVHVPDAEAVGPAGVAFQQQQRHQVGTSWDNASAWVQYGHVLLLFNHRLEQAHGFHHVRCPTVALGDDSC